MREKTPVGRHLAACPECGAPIQATVKVHLSDAVIAQDEQGSRVIGYRSGFGPDRNQPIAIDLVAAAAWGDLELYCENDHDLSTLLSALPKVPA